MTAHRISCPSVCLAAASLLLAMLGGCAGMARDSTAYYGPSEALADAAPSPTPQAARASGEVEKAREEVAAAATSEDGVVSGKAPSEPAAQPASAPEPEQRLRVYSGYLELVVNEVEQTRERIVDLVGQIGGYVETTTAEYVVVRVPAERFDLVMEGFSLLGEVRARSVESTDVTESYADLGRRIEIARHTRQRLYDLLEKTTDVEERVKILREIRRLTEEIEQMTASLAVMEGQIALSRITVRLSSRIDEASGAGIPFPWIAGLSPLYPSSRASVAEIVLAIPPDLAIFERGKRVRLEAADGTRVSIGALTNEPRGDTAFWRDALLFHLKGLYRGLTEIEAGSFRGAVFESKDIEPFHYLVAVTARGEEILIAEAFFPDASSRERRLSGIVSMLEGVKP